MYNLSVYTVDIMSLTTQDLWIVQRIAFLEINIGKFVMSSIFASVSCKLPHAMLSTTSELIAQLTKFISHSIIVQLFLDFMEVH